MKQIFLICIWLLTCGFQGYFLTTLEEIQHGDDKATWTTKRPVLDGVPMDWKVVGEFQGFKIVHVLGHETRDKAVIGKLRKDMKFLGKDLASIENDAILKQLLYSIWYTGQLDEDGNKLRHRGNMVEWLKAGKPERLIWWTPPMVWVGHPVVMPDESKMNQLMGIITIPKGGL